MGKSNNSRRGKKGRPSYEIAEKKRSKVKNRTSLKKETKNQVTGTQLRGKHMGPL